MSTEKEWNEWTANFYVHRPSNRKLYAAVTIICLCALVVFAALPIWPHTITTYWSVSGRSSVYITPFSSDNLDFYFSSIGSNVTVIGCIQGCVITCAPYPNPPCSIMALDSRIIYGSLLP